MIPLLAIIIFMMNFFSSLPRRGGGTNPGLNRAAEERQCPETGQPVIHEVLDDPEYVYLRFHAYR